MTTPYPRHTAHLPTIPRWLLPASNPKDEPLHSGLYISFSLDLDRIARSEFGDCVDDPGYATVLKFSTNRYTALVTRCVRTHQTSEGKRREILFDTVDAYPCGQVHPRGANDGGICCTPRIADEGGLTERSEDVTFQWTTGKLRFSVAQRPKDARKKCGLLPNELNQVIKRTLQDSFGYTAKHIPLRWADTSLPVVTSCDILYNTSKDPNEFFDELRSLDKCVTPINLTP